MNAGAEGFVRNTGSGIKTRKTISIYLKFSDSGALHTASDIKSDQKRAGVRVARYCRPGKVIVRTAPRSGNANERTAYGKSILSGPLFSRVGIVADRGKAGIRTAQSVPSAGKKSPTGSGAGGLTEKRVSV